MMTGWIYEEETDQWYHANEDGALTTGWYQAGNAWYWFDSKYKMYNRGTAWLMRINIYFYENGQMAANQYVGLFYMDENGQRDKRYDIVIEGKSKESSVASETKDEITAALERIPRGGSSILRSTAGDSLLSG